MPVPVESSGSYKNRLRNAFSHVPTGKHYFELQQRAQFSLDADEAKRAYLSKRKPNRQ
jgi:hypothetical protein